MTTFNSFYTKVGRLRLYSGTGGSVTTPYFFEVPFRDGIGSPIDRPRAGETLVLDRGRFTPDAHYVSPPDDPLLAAVPFSCRFRLANTEPNFSKILTIIRARGGVINKLIGGKPWPTSKGTTQIYNSDPLGSGLITTPPFTDAEKHCVNVEILWTDPQSIQNRGFQYNEVYFPPDRQLTEQADGVFVDLSGEIYGAITPITAFTAGNES
jgi:hypothetical protein